MKKNRILHVLTAYLLLVCMLMTYTSVVSAFDGLMKSEDDHIIDNGTEDFGEDPFVSAISLAWSGLSDGGLLSLRDIDRKTDADLFDSVQKAIPGCFVRDMFGITVESGKVLDADAGIAVTMNGYITESEELVSLYARQKDGSWMRVPYIAADNSVSFALKDFDVFAFVDGADGGGKKSGGMRGEPDRSDAAVTVDAFRTTLRSGAVLNENGDYVWDAANNYADHAFVFRVTYSISGTYDYEPGEIRMRVPASILVDRNGMPADYRDLSIPSSTDDGLTEANIFVYREEVDPDTGEVYILVYNRIACPAAQNGYFEVSYNTSNRVSSYADYDPDGIGEANGNTNPKNGSDPFVASIEINQSEAHVEASAPGIPVYINSNVHITSTSKKAPLEVSREWNPSWGTAPADAADYYYLIWEIRSIITDVNQPYDFSIVDTFNVQDGDVVGYKMQGEMGYTSAANGGGVAHGVTSSYIYGRYDYVLTRHKKSTYDAIVDTAREYTLANSVDAVVHPIDGVDDDTTASASCAFTYFKPEFTIPPGEFGVWKYGLDHSNREAKDSDYIRVFNLSEYRDGEIDKISNIAFYATEDGYSYPWTIPENADPNDPANYGIEPVTFVLTDNEFHIRALGGSEESRQLTRNEYEMERVDLAWRFFDAVYDADELKFKTVAPTFDANETIDVYAEIWNGTENEWKLVGQYNLSTSTFNITSYGSSIGVTTAGKSLYFADNSVSSTGVRVVTTNAHYYSNISIRPYIGLKRSALVDAVVDEAFADGQNKIYIHNICNGSMYDGAVPDEEYNIYSTDRDGYDYALGVKREGNIEKEIVGYYNDTINRNYQITWKINADESYLAQGGVREFVLQEGGRLYDLMPEGCVYSPSSLSVYADNRKLSAGEYTVQTVENYRNSGRLLVIIDITTPADRYSAQYMTLHSWDSISEYGPDVLNSVAYETGNNNIGDGRPDDGGVITDHELMADLDPATNDDKFIYTETNHSISAITAGSLGLYKQVKAAGDDGYSYSTLTHNDSDYSYRIRFATDDATMAKDLVLMDSLENFVIPAGPEQGRTSDWHGSFKGFNTAILDASGLNYEIWYSLTNGLDINTLGVDDSYDFSAHGSTWVRASSYTGDLSAVKAFAIDMRKTAGGDDQIIDPDTAISVTVYMHSPVSLSDNIADPVALNNIYLYNAVKGADESTEWSSSLNHQDYTQLRYRLVGDLNILKVDTTDNTKPVSGIKFRLWGTSFYGTDVDMTMTTNTLGRICFEDVELGTYSLQEVDGVADYQQDHMLMTVTVAADGDVYIGVPVDDGNGNITYDYSVYGSLILNYDPVSGTYTIGNEPRIHGSARFAKRVSIDGTTNTGVLPGVTFKISGTSSYGNEVVMFVTSDNTGSVVIENLEYGEYDMVEVDVPAGIIKSNARWKVRCDSTGHVSINEVLSDGSESPLTVANNGMQTIVNEPKHSFTLRKYDNVNNASLSGAEFRLVGVSNYGNAVDMTVSSDASGLVHFTGLESGSYVLREITAPQYHELDTAPRLVVVGADGTVTVNGCEIDDEYGWVLFPNERSYEGLITITKTWVDADPSERPIPVIHIDSNEPSFGLPIVTISKSKWSPLFVDQTTNSKIAKRQVVELRNIDDYPDAVWSVAIDVDDDTTDYDLEILYDPSDVSVIYYRTNAGLVYFPESCEGLFSGWVDVTSLDIGDWSTSKVTNMTGMFRECNHLTNIDVSNWDTSHVKTFNNMFYNDGALASLDVSGWDMSSATEISYMFYYCSSLASLDVSNWDTSEVVSLNATFQYCGSLADLDVSGWNTSKVRNMGAAFMATAITTLDVSHWDVSKVRQFASMFQACPNLNYLDTSNWNVTSLCTNLGNMFLNCSALPYVDVADWDTSNVTSIARMFDGCSTIDNIDVSNWDTGKVTSLHQTFYRCSSLTNLGAANVRDWDVSSVTLMSRTFMGCSLLTSLDVSGWRTPSLTSLEKTFSGCSSLTSLGAQNVGGWDTSNVTTLDSTFLDCSLLTDIDVSGWDTSQVTSLRATFSNCYAVRELDVSGWDTSNVTTMYYTFKDCQSITELDVSGFVTSNVTNFDYTLAGLYLVTDLDVSGWDVSQGTEMIGMFFNDLVLTSLDLSSFDTSNMEGMTNLFYRNFALETIYVSDRWSLASLNVDRAKTMFTNCYQLTGGSGTHFNAANPSDYTYAHIDGGPSDPGYFTYKTPGPYNTPSAVNPIVTTQSVVNGDQGIGYDILAAVMTGTVMSEGTPTRSELVSSDLVSNSELYDGADPDGAYDVWVDNGDGTWTYRFHVYSGEATYYIWEGALPGYTSDMDGEHPLVVHYANGVLTADPADDPRLVVTDIGGVLHYSLNVTNTATVQSDANLTVRKLVTGSPDAEDLTHPFRFRVTLYTDAALTQLSHTTARYGDMTFLDGAAEFTLAHGQTISALHLPVGLYYSVEELDGAFYGFTVSSVNDTGLLTANASPVCTYTNHRDDYGSPHPTGGFKIHKTVVRQDGLALGASDLAKSFMFGIRLSDDLTGVYGDVVFNNGVGYISLKHDETAVIMGLPLDTEYIVVEASYSGYVTTSTDDYGYATEALEMTAEFVNTKLPVPKNGFVLRKQVDGLPSASGFTFHIDFAGLEAGTSYNYTNASGGTSSIIADSQGEAHLTVLLNDGESVVFRSLPVGSTYSITEDGSAYIASYSVTNDAAAGAIVSAHGSNAITDQSLHTAVETVDQDEQIEVLFKNTSPSFDVVISKMSEGGMFIPGATLRVVNSRGETVAEWITTGVQDTVALPTGDYILAEISAPDGYTIAEPIAFTVSDTGVVTVNGHSVMGIVMTDPETKLTVNKVDDNGDPVSGAKLQILDRSGSVICSWITDENPYELTGALNIMTQYYIHEAVTPDGYDGLEEDIPFVIDTDGVVWVNGMLVFDVAGNPDILGGTEARHWTITVVNRNNAVNLTLSKTVTGNMGDKTELFRFDVTVTGASGDYVLQYNDGTESSVTFTDGVGTVHLAHGQSVTIVGLPYGSTYSIVEVNYAPYTVQATNESGTLTEDKSASFVNHLNTLIPSGVVVSPWSIAILVTAAAGMIIVVPRRRRRED